ncbi:hypothetical protein ACFYKX_07515 [Cytobacillus sp. FJAT-54145]|uniref:Uncharacterized protein n=1 Tax=Cytobacillus spartinae TaxID=3299023 RepID=A0ABW6K8D6_9BACI
MKIVETEYSVIINGTEIEGFIDKEQTCSNCQANLIYYDEFDAYFCAYCNEWKESKCEDPTCFYCPNRPNKPLNN